MSPALAILVCDNDPDFREELRNFLLTAGCPQVEVVSTAREALARLRRESYRCVLVGISRSHSVARRLATVVQRRQPGTKVILIVGASDASFIRDSSFVYLIRERAFSSLLELLTDERGAAWETPGLAGGEA